MFLSVVKVRVPASTSNLGPGFDCLGLAVNLYNTVEVRRAESSSHRGMVAETARHFFSRVESRGIKPFGFEVAITGDVPVSRGLGSSVTVRLGVLLGLAELVRPEAGLSREEILPWLIELEGHPDNAVASCLGGFAVCAPAAPGFSYTRAKVGPELTMVTLVPELKLATEKARALLPREVPLHDAVENAQRAARLAALFCTGDYGAMRGLFADHLHQPFRRILIPGFDEILEAANRAGALGSFLSGAGSSMMALTLEHPEAIGESMLQAAKKNDLPAQVLLLHADNRGAQVLKA
jgi:homoserine kinase